MNVYDFDGTLRYGDSTADFYLWCLRRHPAILLELPGLALYALRFAAGNMTKTRFKQQMYRFLRYVPDIDREVEAFWVRGREKLMSWYTPHEGDLVISASPEFLLEPICRELGVRLLASRVNPKTGVYDGLNCHGEEKLRRFREAYPGAGVEEFCSDSYSDSPLAEIAGQAYLIRKGKKQKWDSAHKR